MIENEIVKLWITAKSTSILLRKTLMTNGQEKCKHSKGELSISTSGYTEDVEKFFDIIIKSMRQEDAEKDDCRLN